MGFVVGITEHALHASVGAMTSFVARSLHSGLDWQVIVKLSPPLHWVDHHHRLGGSGGRSGTTPAFGSAWVWRPRNLVSSKVWPPRVDRTRRGFGVAPPSSWIEWITSFDVGGVHLLLGLGLSVCGLSPILYAYLH